MPAARGTQAWNGVLAAVAGCSVAFVVGLATSTPFVANGIADRIMEATPLPIATRLLSTLGPAAKPLSLAGALAVVAVLAAAAGWLTPATARGAGASMPSQDGAVGMPDKDAGPHAPDRDVEARLPDQKAGAHAPDRDVEARLPDQKAGAHAPERDAEAHLVDRGAEDTAPNGDGAPIPDRGAGAELRHAGGQAGKREAIERASAGPKLLGTSRSGRVGALTQPLPLGWERSWGALALAAAQAGVIVLLAGTRSWQGVVLPYSVWAFVMVALSQEPAASADRRWFLRRSVQAAGGLVLLSTAATWTLLAKTLAGARPGRALFAFEAPAPRQPAFAGVEGLSPEVTPITSFYLMSKTVEDPAVDAGSWRLRIRGLVQRELELTYDDLARLPRTNQWLTLRCVSNPVGGPLIGNALWSGVTLPAVLSLAGVQPAATTLVLAAHDGYSDSVPLERAQRDSTLLAYAVNGGLLNRDHGFPARVLVPGLYGFKNVKWVEELRLIAGDFEGPWQRLGWTRTAIQTTFSRIDFVRRTPAGALAGGIAYAGDRGIRSVEVRAGGQPWREAALHTPPLGSLSWVQWLFPFQASGRTAVTVRATDSAGALQEETERGIFPDGASGWHTVTAELLPA